MIELNWKKITINIIIGYAISCIYYLGTVSILQKLLGKTEGMIINYGLSWIVWYIVFDSLHTLNPSGDL